MSKPRVSVIMSVYNGSTYLRESVESILSQTYTDFEFIIIDDCSSDTSWDSLTRFAQQDSRIVLLQNESNLGLAASLNRGIAAAQGEYIARMDDDDVALPDRLEKQVAYLESHPEVALLSTPVQYIDPDGAPMEVYSPPLDATLLRWKLIYCSPPRHPSVMWRKRAVEAVVKGYNPQNRYAEDYEFFCAISRSLTLETLPLTLLKMRQRPGSVSFAKVAEQDQCAAKVTSQQFDYYFPNPRLSQADKEGLRAFLRRFSPVQSAVFEAMPANSLKTAFYHYLQLFDNFCLIHQSELSQASKAPLYQELELSVAYSLKHCFQKGWSLMGLGFLVSYCSRHPNRAVAMIKTASGYAAYSGLKQIGILQQGMQAVRKLYYKRANRSQYS